jgi:hypothetical protein
MTLEAAERGVDSVARLGTMAGMALDKAIEHGKERRRGYHKSAAFDRTCRPGGTCPYCSRGRQHKNRKRLRAAKEQQAECP